MINDGGPAFPVLIYDTLKPECDKASTGMSLRDYFAAKAIQILIRDVPDEELDSGYTTATLAKVAYTYADAMLKARECD